MFIRNINLTCTKDFNCTQNEFNRDSDNYVYIVMAVLGTFGTIANPLRHDLRFSFFQFSKIIYSLFLSFMFIDTFNSYYIFSTCKDELNQKFLNIMKVYILNSFAFSLSEMTTFIYTLAVTDAYYHVADFNFPFTPHYKLMLYTVHIYVNFYSLSYSFGSLMDIYITWGRIQALKPHYMFLRNTSVILYFYFIHLFLIYQNQLIHIYLS